MNDYTKMTNDDFMDTLNEILFRDPYKALARLLDTGNILGEIMEQYNDDVLDQWAENNPQDAYGEGNDDEQ